MGRMISKTENNEAGKSYVPYSYLCGNTKILRYKLVSDPFVYRELESMTGQHPRVMPIAQNVMELFSECITEMGAPITDLILSEAITEWSERVHVQGINSAFKAYCRSILEKLPMVFELRVTGQKRHYPYPVVMWNPLTQTLVEWLEENGVVNLKVDKVQNDSSLSRREISLLIASRVFDREELMLFGLGDIYGQETMATMEVKRKIIAPSEGDKRGSE